MRPKKKARAGLPLNAALLFDGAKELGSFVEGIHSSLLGASLKTLASGFRSFQRGAVRKSLVFFAEQC